MVAAVAASTAGITIWKPPKRSPGRAKPRSSRAAGAASVALGRLLRWSGGTVATANTTLCCVLLGLTTTYPPAAVPELDDVGFNTVTADSVVLSFRVELGTRKGNGEL